MDMPYCAAVIFKLIFISHLEKSANIFIIKYIDVSSQFNKSSLKVQWGGGTVYVNGITQLSAIYYLVYNCFSNGSLL